MSSKLTIQVEAITPSIAAQMLGTTAGNRNLRQRDVNRYAREMVAGKWGLNGESIKFSWDGHLRDGHHRLTAVIASGMTVQMVVVRNIDPATFVTLDTGVSRNYHDASIISGRDWPMEVGSIARLWLRYERGFMVSKASRVVVATHQELDEVVERHPGIPESARFIKTLKAVQNKCSASVQGFVHAFCSERYDREMADSFMQDLNDGAQLEMTSPIYALRQRLLEQSTKRRRLEQVVVLAYTIKAWNAWMDGAPVQSLKWASGGDKPEPFPVFGVDRPPTKSAQRNAKQRRERAAALPKVIVSRNGTTAHRLVS